MRKPHIMLANSKEITRRAGCKRQGWFRIYVRAGGGQPGKFSTTQTFSVQGDIEYRNRACWGGDMLAHKLCETEMLASWFSVIS